MSKSNPFAGKSLINCVIAEESTVTGLLLTGMGQRSKNGDSNYLIVTKDTSDADIEKEFSRMIDSPEVGIIFIS